MLLEVRKVFILAVMVAGREHEAPGGKRHSGQEWAGGPPIAF